MDFDWDASFELGGQLDDVGYAERRLEGRIYMSRSFVLRFDSSRDFGERPGT